MSKHSGYLFYEVISSIALFVITYYWSASKYSPSIYFEITLAGATEYFSIVAQAVGSLIGFFLVFLVFFMQFADSAKSRSFAILKDKAGQLNGMLLNCPEQLADLFVELNSLTTLLISMELRDFPLNHDKLVQFNRIISVIKKPRSGDLEDLYIRQLIWILNDVEVEMQKLNTHYVVYKSINYEFEILAKLFLLMVFSLLMVVLIGTVDLKNVIPNLLFPISISFSFWMIWVFIEIFQTIKYFLMNFVESWKWA